MKIYSTRNTVAAAMAFFILSGISALGHASNDREKYESVRVSYADLDLENAAGREALAQRLRRAAQSVCEKPGRNSLREMIAERECEQKALSEAIRDAGLQREVATYTH